MKDQHMNVMASVFSLPLLLVTSLACSEPIDLFRALVETEIDRLVATSNVYVWCAPVETYLEYPSENRQQDSRTRALTRWVNNSVKRAIDDCHVRAIKSSGYDVRPSGVIDLQAAKALRSHIEKVSKGQVDAVITEIEGMLERRASACNRNVCIQASNTANQPLGQPLGEWLSNTLDPKIIMRRLIFVTVVLAVNTNSAIVVAPKSLDGLEVRDARAQTARSDADAIGLVHSKLVKIAQLEMWEMGRPSREAQEAKWAAERRKAAADKAAREAAQRRHPPGYEPGGKD
jgi:hypothetical protein